MTNHSQCEEVTCEQMLKFYFSTSNPYQHNVCSQGDITNIGACSPIIISQAHSTTSFGLLFQLFFFNFIFLHHIILVILLEIFLQSSLKLFGIF